MKQSAIALHDRALSMNNPENLTLKDLGQKV